MSLMKNLMSMFLKRKDISIKRMAQKYIVGDWVKFLFEESKVIEVYEDGSYYMDSPNITGCPKEEELSPIPLTTEILEKNGWKLHKHHKRDSYDDVSWSSYHKPAETNISLRFYTEEKAFFLFLYAEEISETPIRYIHQLQHILFGLGLNSEMEV